MTSGGQCVMTRGKISMPQWSASSWDMQPQEVSLNILLGMNGSFQVSLPVVQVELHMAMLPLVLVLGLSTWMMLLALQVTASYWSAIAGQS